MWCLLLALFYASSGVNVATTPLPHSGHGMEVSDLKIFTVYVGCYLDKGNRAMGNMKRESSSMNLDLCKKHCIGYQYIGLQNGNQCWCGNNPDKYGKTNEGDCNKRCKGSAKGVQPSEMCGGRWRNSVYKRLDPQLDDKYVKPYKYKDCYYDQKKRILPNKIVNSHQDLKNMGMSTILCRFYCDEYKYFGTESKDQCFCGNKLEETPKTSIRCNQRCDGAEKEMCGGHWRISIYEVLTYNKTNNWLYSYNWVFTPGGVMDREDLVYHSEYQGCYADSKSGRTMPSMKRETKKMNVNLCKYHCVGYRYFGLENANQCFCSDFMPKDAAKETDCDKECKGANDKSICGGSWKLSVYRRLDPALHDNYEKPYRYVNCYADKGGNVKRRVLRHRQKNPGDLWMSVFRCRYLCEQYKYFGVESGDQCYCDNSINPSRKTSSKCNEGCKGAWKEICGGHWKISVYERKDYKSSNMFLIPT